MVIKRMHRSPMVIKEFAAGLLHIQICLPFSTLIYGSKSLRSLCLDADMQQSLAVLAQVGDTTFSTVQTLCRLQQETIDVLVLSPQILASEASALQMMRSCILSRRHTKSPMECAQSSATASFELLMASAVFLV